MKKKLKNYRISSDQEHSFAVQVKYYTEMIEKLVDCIKVVSKIDKFR